MTYPTKYEKQSAVYWRLRFAFEDAHNSADWLVAHRLGKRFYRVKRWCKAHEFTDL